MSQIKLKHSGGNSVIIAAPDSNPASDRTLKLPSNADGTVLTTTNPRSGAIIQVQTTQDVTSAAVNCAQNVFTNLSSINVSITPVFASSKILISGFMTGEGNKKDISWTFKMMRSVAGGSDQDVLRGTPSGNRISCMGAFPTGHFNEDNDSTPITVSFANLLDSPSYSVGQAIVYKMFINCINSGAVWSINSTNGSSNSTDYERSASYITVMEVAQ
jgi:hypothetical protein